MLVAEVSRCDKTKAFVSDWSVVTNAGDPPGHAVRQVATPSRIDRKRKIDDAQETEKPRLHPVVADLGSLYRSKFSVT